MCATFSISLLFLFKISRKPDDYAVHIQVHGKYVAHCLPPSLPLPKKKQPQNKTKLDIRRSRSTKKCYQNWLTSTLFEL